MHMWYLFLSIQEGVTALMMVSQKGLTSVVKLLLEGKANPNVQDKVIITEGHALFEPYY